MSPEKLQKISVAFANADGGEIVIGIADEKNEPDIEKRWNGFARMENFNGILQAINEVSPSLDIDYSFLKADAYPGYVLHVVIEKSSYVHQTADKKVYVRKGAQSLLYSTQKIQELSFAKGTVSFEDQKLPDVHIEDVTDSTELSLFLKDHSPQTKPLDFVTMQNLVERRTLCPKVCGVLIFTSNPSALMPRKCAVKIARYETREDDPERDHLSKIFTIEAPLYRQIYETVDKITEIMSSISVWKADGLGRLEYPPEAIWEIIVNAIIHRDYSISDDVQVLIFNNRIEIISPGKLPSFVTAENILETRYSRNPKIVRTLNKYPNPPNKDLGEGLNTAFQKMKEFKLKSPVVEELEKSVKVTIPHIPLAQPTELILEFLKTQSKITNKQCRDLTGIKSENLVKVEFYKLRDAGLLEMIPGLRGPSAAWQLTKKNKKHK